MTVNEYLKTLEGIRAFRVGAIVAYIRATYPEVIEGVYIAPHSQMPTFENAFGSIAIGSTKSYVSIYFSNWDGPAMVVAKNPKIKRQKSCINIRDGVSFDLDDVTVAIDLCLEVRESD